MDHEDTLWTRITASESSSHQIVGQRRRRQYNGILMGPPYLKHTPRNVALAWFGKSNYQEVGRGKLDGLFLPVLLNISKYYGRGAFSYLLAIPETHTFSPIESNVASLIWQEPLKKQSARDEDEENLFWFVQSFIDE